ncbi:synapse-associated protein of 47 kDa isoform X3 [Ischnura elegans]|uniref:synapse-associated protein of 47 kDa isoform X3 n=1 Tax=Ischnura elegans TaxID=197161 RepID=UPI001ED8BC6F|nr:synapse-associated protein of 47 kDa isoform X3 [Ischnura elegans]
MDMFSGITSQVSSWMGNKKQEGGEVPPKPEEENVSSPVQESGESSIPPADNKKESPTKTSRLEMFASVKSQMTSWLGGSNAAAGEAAPTEEGSVPEPSEEFKADPLASEKPAKSSPAEGKEDDDSSATGGADSDAAGSEGSRTPVSTKAIQGAKSIGNFLFSAVNKAGKTVSEAGAKIKKTVEENSILGEFNREQEAFIKEKQRAGGGEGISDGTTPAPWVGYPNEEALKEQILSLSTERRNFVRGPPVGVEFQFDLESFMPMAQATLAQDPNLQQMRFELVPKVISEENFWRNYFYRVGLIRQSSDLTSMAEEGGTLSRGASESGPDGADVKPSLGVTPVVVHHQSTHSEFVSDSMPGHAPHEIEKVRQDVEKLGISPKKTDEEGSSAKGTNATGEEDWEKELHAELQSFEIVEGKGVGGQAGKGNNDQDLEDEIQEMLDAEEEEDYK